MTELCETEEASYLPKHPEVYERDARLVERFCEAQRIERNPSEHTLRAYAGDLTSYIMWADSKGVDITATSHRQMRAYLAELDQARYARSTINRRLSAVRGFYRWLTVSDLAKSDPASVLSGPKKPKTLPHVLRPQETVKLLSVYGPTDAQGNPREQSLTDKRNQAMLEFMYACGARVSETSGLLTLNIDFAQGQAKVFGKGAKERIVPLHDMALRSMADYMTHARGQLLGKKQSDYFFVSTRGNQMTTDAIRKMFKQALAAAGLDTTLSPHALRHTFATDVLAGGADLRTVQEMLGHVSLSTTQIYTHTTAGRLKEVHSQAHPRG